MDLAVANFVAEAALPFVFNFKSNADCVAFETGLAASDVLSTEPNPTINLVTPETVPVNAGETNDAFESKSEAFAFKARAAFTSAVFDFKFKAACAAEEIGFSESDVLSTEPKPTIDFVMPEIVPVKVGEANDAFESKSVVFAFKARAAFTSAAFAFKFNAA